MADDTSTPPVDSPKKCIYKMLSQAAKEGDVQSVQRIYDELKTATTDETLIKIIINRAMAKAAWGGHEAIMRLCHDEWGATDVDWAMARAAAGGHEAIMRLCHDVWGASDVDRAMACAAAGGHEAIVRLCHDVWGATDVDRAMACAAAGGHEAIVRLCHDVWGRTAHYAHYHVPWSTHMDNLRLSRPVERQTHTQPDIITSRGTATTHAT